MSIVSFSFLAFALTTVTLYFIVPKKWQWVVILIANLVFYAASGVGFLAYIFATSLVTYWIAIKIEQVGDIGSQLSSCAGSPELRKEVKSGILSIKKMLCAVAILVGMGIWVVLKYGGFFLENANAVARAFRLDWQVEPLSFVLPLGISFYTFHAVGYLVDVYRAKYPAEHNFGKFFAFVSFFPHIIQGPFSRFDQLGRSMLEPHTFSYDRLCVGCARILWGVCKKVLVADKLGIAVVAIFADYQQYSGMHILFAIFGHCIRLYADFSGYMDIVCGISYIMGIELAENFNQPYFAKSIDEFWRRWHITLGKWFKDYVFYPVSMGKVGQKLGKWARKKYGPKMGKLIPGYFALIFVWTATGLWHGANWTYLVWGYLNLFVIMSAMQLSDTYEKIKQNLHINSDGLFWSLFCILRTFCLVCFFRFFSVADSLHTSLSMLKHTALELHPDILKTPLRLFVGMERMEVAVVAVGVLCMLLIDILKEAGKWERIKERTPMPGRNLVYAFLLVALVLFAGGNNDLVGGFMYANF